MKRLSRDNIEIIANRVFKAYKALPDIKNSECYRVEPEKLILEVLGLNIGIEHLSLSGDTLGLTTFREMGVEVYDDTDEPFIYFLDGKTILVEKSLKQDITKIGRYNFSLMHEASHQIYKMLFPNDYGIPSRERSPVHFNKVNNEHKKTITDWEEWQANALASAILLPRELVEKGMFRFSLGDKIEVLNKIYFHKVYEQFSGLAQYLGVSRQALAIRMKQLGLLNNNYLNNPDGIIEIVGEKHDNER